MPAISQEQLRRLAARSIRVLNRQKDAAPAIGAYVGSLDVEAREFIAAYDLVRTSASARRNTRASGVEETEKLVQTLRMWIAHVNKDVPSFDRGDYLLRPTVTDDVVADAERLLDVVQDHQETGGALTWVDAFTVDLEAALEATRATMGQHNDKRANLSEYLADAREKAEKFYEELVAFRRTIRAFLGSTHADVGLLRNRSSRGTGEDEDLDTVEDLEATAASLRIEDEVAMAMDGGTTEEVAAAS